MFCFYQVSNKYLMQLVALVLARTRLISPLPTLDRFEIWGVGKQEKNPPKSRCLHQPPITRQLSFSALLKLSLFNIDHTEEPAKYGVNWVHWNPCPWDQELPRQEAEGGVGRRGPAARRMRCKCTDTGLLLPALQSSRGISHPPPSQKLGNSFHFYFFFPPSGNSSGINSSLPLFFFLFLSVSPPPPLQSFFYYYYFILLFFFSFLQSCKSSALKTAAPECSCLAVLSALF